MQTKWDGINLEDVYDDWADALQSFTVGAIGYGIDISKTMKHPPNQGEFIHHCMEYSPPKIYNNMQIVKKESQMTKEEAKSKLTKLKEMIESSEFTKRISNE